MPNTDARLEYRVSDLGIMDHAGSAAHAISDQGDVIGTLGAGRSGGFSPQTNHSFLWSEGKVTDFGRARAVLQINNKGQIAGIRYLSGFAADFSLLKVSPILYSNGRWKSILPKGACSGSAAGLNDTGQVAGQVWLDASQPQHFSAAVWRDSEIQLLEIPKPHTSGIVKGINNAGQAVGVLQEVVSKSSYRTSAVLWDGSSVTQIGSLPGAAGQSEAVAINNNGCVLGVATFNWDKSQKYVQDIFEGQAQSKVELPLFGGFLWNGGEIIPLTRPDEPMPGINLTKGCVARALSDKDVVVGRAANSDGELIAFRWQRHTMVDLNTLIPAESGWTLTDAKDLNNQGQIVGQGKYGGRSHAFLLTPL